MQVTATIKDVAREAKVSVASVSRALNGSGGVTPATEQRIREAATRLRYVPHGAARSLITKRTHTVGALMPDLHGEFFSELIRGIDLEARSHGLHLLVSSSHDGVDDAAAALRAMQGRVDGIVILSSPRVDAAFLDANLPEGLPTVLLNSGVKGTAHAVLNIDNFAGTYAMVRHLAGLGHKRIALVSGPKDNFDAQQREAGFRAAMAELAPNEPLRVVAGDFSEQSGYQAGLELLALKTRPQAVFAANDMMAVGCLQAFKEAGVEVPGEIALAGFDDIPIARYVTPSLSTVRVRIADLGKNAMDLLADLMDRPGVSAASVHTLGCDIVVRESCGAQRGAAAGATTKKTQRKPVR
ncbi:LacI family DNA-binding transcriptional regulator [Rhodanobacter sp. DHB23]|uniref:LacI family DNA-binding transcriptional regulator n=1 Tax=Rhodanobacter sp. DHB23 TaxID=2775923 RepID=UPI00177F6639|nr:LacI family DNA-binding transcriptional regulator [Rhodanobacter sp. DHB23]MBD8872683.1 LacI family DNA-binding transcriptional regulator [Rhodanobacter sp. DHB23]